MFFLNFQAERLRKEEADAHRKAEDEAKKKIALSNMGSGYSSILQRVSVPPSPWWWWWGGVQPGVCDYRTVIMVLLKCFRLNRREGRG